MKTSLQAPLSSYKIRKLGINEKVKSFDCGDADLNDFILNASTNRFRKHRFVNEKRLKSYPAAKICRLAINQELKGQHIGQFLINFIKSFFLADNKTGCRFLTVDAYAAAIPFYLKQKFVPLTVEDEGAETRLIYFDLNDIAD